MPDRVLVRRAPPRVVTVRVPERLRNLLDRRLHGRRASSPPATAGSRCSSGVLGDERLDYLLVRLGAEAEWVDPALQARRADVARRILAGVRDMRRRARRGAAFARRGGARRHVRPRSCRSSSPPSTTDDHPADPDRPHRRARGDTDRPDRRAPGRALHRSSTPASRSWSPPAARTGWSTRCAAGSTGDVFASVGTRAVDQLAIDGHLASQPLVFGSDPLVLIVPPGNPERSDRHRRPREPRSCDRALQPRLGLRASLRRGVDAGGRHREPRCARDRRRNRRARRSRPDGRAAGLAYRTDVTASVSFARPRASTCRHACRRSR